MKEVIAILHNIRSAHNVGSIFRTADGAGITKMYLTGYTPRPFRKGWRGAVFPTKAEKELAKTALGAEQNMAWEYRRSLRAVWERVYREGYRMVAIEQLPGSVAYDAYHPEGKTALLMGNEVRGIDPKTLKKCDVVLEIPMRGQKNSLNVSVAFGIASYAIASTMEREGGRK